jgi:RHS repeat-associated protein
MKLTYILLLFYFIGFSQGNNFTKTTIYKIATTTPIANPDIAQAQQSITFYDGQGRQIQAIARKASNNSTNIVEHTEYDANGKASKKYLPYVSTNSGLAYESTALNSTLTYSDGATINYSGQNPYVQDVYETSSNGRLLYRAAPGSEWAVGSGHEIKFQYSSNNTTTDVVKYYSATSAWNSGSELYLPTLTNTGTTNYAVNELYVAIVKNENWVSADGNNNTLREYSDRKGNIVLRRTFEAGVPVDTYYVYDQFNNLSFVIPPLVTNAVTQMDDLCYQYRYDKRNRLVERKIPGKQWEFIIYDNQNRVIATGPSFSPFKDLTTSGWMVSKYDVFDRVVYTGWLNSSATSATRKTMQSTQNSIISNLSEVKQGTNTIDGITVYYSSLSQPTGIKLLAVNYYDNYTFPDAPTSIPGTLTGVSQAVFYNNTAGYQPKRLLTGTWVRVLEASTSTNATKCYFLYDNKARKVRDYSKNYLGGITQIDYQINFSGNVLQTETTHYRAAAPAIVIKDFFTYTSQGRLYTHIQQIGTGQQLIKKNSYNALGQLIGKNVGGTDVSTFTGLQKIGFSYNMRGWLKTINDVANLQQGTDPLDLFAFKLNYNNVENPVNTEIKPLYNGNISETYWKTSTDDIERSYGYKYDKLDRITNSYYHREAELTNSYNESLSYDLQGNVIHLDRFGGRDEFDTPIQIDNLTYSYDTGMKNRLTKVFDSTNNPQGFDDDSTDGITDPNGNDYGYDLNGNITNDQNKNITSIIYNHLNLPLKIVFANNNNSKIEYVYDAVGTLVKKTVRELDAQAAGGVKETITDYLNGFQYTGSVLRFFPHAEGYVSNKVVSGNNVYSYVFQYKDHLGNIRVNYAWDTPSSSAKILEENHYYPFGLKHENYNSEISEFAQMASGFGIMAMAAAGGQPARSLYQYKYNGKEFQDELSLNTYSYGARSYDPAIGRWTGIDLLAESMTSQSPYSYGYNNPIFYIDSGGFEPTPYEAALMANFVYDGKGPLTGGWAQASRHGDWDKDDKKTGLKAMMFQRTKADGRVELAYVYAGTAPSSAKDWVNNVAQAEFPGLAKQYQQAVEMSLKASEYWESHELTFVGHSLGGGLSNLSSGVTGRKSITFNPAWLSNKTLKKYKKEIIDTNSNPMYGRITNYVNIFDQLNIAQVLGGDGILQEVGKTEYLSTKLDEWADVLAAHMMGVMLDVLEELHLSTAHVENGDDDIVPVERDDDGDTIIHRSSRTF